MRPRVGFTADPVSHRNADILEAVDRFCTIYVADIATHNFHPNATTSPHPALATAEALSRSCQHLRAQARGT